jgi:hypothetical protein
VEIRRCASSRIQLDGRFQMQQRRIADGFGCWQAMLVQLKLTILAVVVPIVLPAAVAGWLQKWLRMPQFGSAGLSVKAALFCGALGVALLYPWINLHLAGRNGATFRAGNLTSASTVAAKLRIRPTDDRCAFVCAAKGSILSRVAQGGVSDAELDCAASRGASLDCSVITSDAEVYSA